MFLIFWVIVKNCKEKYIKKKEEVIVSVVEKGRLELDCKEF